MWAQVGLTQLKEFMFRKRLDSESTFYRFLGHLNLGKEGRITKTQWRDVLKKENLSFNLPQIDCLFKNIDSNHDNAIDMNDWLHSVIDDCNSNCCCLNISL